MEARFGAEMRRLHIVYFLSRKDRNEHPHLIRVYHLSKNGVRLKDIKRWLGELRGKDMPESFSWSYKRRYKAGYVWQDLLDDDLVTPISDNEYVLKGSEISLYTNNIEQLSLQESGKDCQKDSSRDVDNQIDSSDSSKIEESSSISGSTTSTLTDDSGKNEIEKNSNTANQEADSSTSQSVPLMNKEKKRRTNKVEMISDKSINTTTASSHKPHFTKSYSSGIFLNLITCGTMNTNDSAVVMTNKRNRAFLNMCSCRSVDTCTNEKNRDGVKYSAKDKSDFRGRARCAAYKPLHGPNCSQCGKTFKPEKLHEHMKFCKGMKTFAKAYNPPVSAAENLSIISTSSRNEDSISGYFLPH